jgi:hypothetical protein
MCISEDVLSISRGAYHHYASRRGMNRLQLVGLLEYVSLQQDRSLLLTISIRTMYDDVSTEPLLTRTVVVPNPASPLSKTSSMNAANQHQARRIWPLLVLLILVNLSTVLYTLPLNRVIELRLCQEHYALSDPRHDGPIPERLCKIDEIQRQLAWLQGIMETTLVVCGTCVILKAISQFG